MVRYGIWCLKMLRRKVEHFQASACRRWNEVWTHAEIWSAGARNRQIQFIVTKKRKKTHMVSKHWCVILYSLFYLITKKSMGRTSRTGQECFASVRHSEDAALRVNSVACSVYLASSEMCKYIICKAGKERLGRICGSVGRTKKNVF